MFRDFGALIFLHKSCVRNFLSEIFWFKCIQNLQAKLIVNHLFHQKWFSDNSTLPLYINACVPVHAHVSL